MKNYKFKLSSNVIIKKREYIDIEAETEEEARNIFAIYASDGQLPDGSYMSTEDYRAVLNKCNVNTDYDSDCAIDLALYLNAVHWNRDLTLMSEGYQVDDNGEITEYLGCQYGTDPWENVKTYQLTKNNNNLNFEDCVAISKFVFNS